LEKREEEDPRPDTSQLNDSSGMGGGMGGMGGRGGHHSNPQPHKAPAAKAIPADKSLQQRLDDNDTEAYENAERSVLKEAQKEKAREIASKYRADLYDRRDMARKRAEAGK
jgi:hypothetical protein